MLGLFLAAASQPHKRLYFARTKAEGGDIVEIWKQLDSLISVLATFLVAETQY